MLYNSDLNLMWHKSVGAEALNRILDSSLKNCYKIVYVLTNAKICSKNPRISLINLSLV